MTEQTNFDDLIGGDPEKEAPVIAPEAEMGAVKSSNKSMYLVIGAVLIVAFWQLNNTFQFIGGQEEEVVAAPVEQLPQGNAAAEFQVPANGAQAPVQDLASDAPGVAPVDSVQPVAGGVPVAPQVGVAEAAPQVMATQPEIAQPTNVPAKMDALTQKVDTLSAAGTGMNAEQYQEVNNRLDRLESMVDRLVTQMERNQPAAGSGHAARPAKVSHKRTSKRSKKDRKETAVVAAVVPAAAANDETPLPQDPAPRREASGSRYNSHVVIPGRAWVVNNEGVFASVVVGDALPGAGKVTAINVDAGEVRTDGGVIRMRGE